MPLPVKLVRLRDPAMRARLLREEPVYSNPQMLTFMRSVANMYVLGDPPDYTPPADSRLDARAAALGITPLELAYDLLVWATADPVSSGAVSSDANIATCCITTTP